MSTTLSTARQHFAEAAYAFAHLTDQIPAGAWSGPGLGEWDLRALVGHTARALLTVETYLGQPATAEEVPTAAAYYARLIPATDHKLVAARGVSAGKDLGPEPAAHIHDVVGRVLALVDEAGNPLVSTLGGGMRLVTYLPTRTLELVVHSLDVAAAAGLERPAYSTALVTGMAELAVGVAALRGRGLDVILALTGRAALPQGFSIVG